MIIKGLLYSRNCLIYGQKRPDLLLCEPEHLHQNTRVSWRLWRRNRLWLESGTGDSIKEIVGARAFEM
jgi:hypothetical protein